jgi:hypothetical protein
MLRDAAMQSDDELQNDGRRFWKTLRPLRMVFCLRSVKRSRN